MKERSPAIIPLCQLKQEENINMAKFLKRSHAELTKDSGNQSGIHFIVSPEPPTSILRIARTHRMPLFLWPRLKPMSDCHMGLKLQCSDLERELNMEATCPFVARGENMEELTEDLWIHAKEVHGYTDEQLLSPKITDAVKAVIKKE